MFNKFVVSEKELFNRVQYYIKNNKIPIIDYAIEFNSKKHHFESKLNHLLKQYPYNYHALKLSAIDFCSETTTRLVENAAQNNCKILIDAENVAVQHKIDNISNHMILTQQGTVFKTYQMYRQDMFDTLMLDLMEFRRLGVQHNIKLVRGAYMHQDKNYDILYNTKEQTDDSYNEAVKTLMMMCNGNDKMNVIFATHNKKSYQLIKYNKNPNVFHASLMGMDKGFDDGHIQKMVYIPFGPYHKTYPYLLRRLYENNFIFADYIQHRGKWRKKEERSLSC